MRFFVLMLFGLLTACQSVFIKPFEVTTVAGQVELSLPEWQSPRERDNPRVGQIEDLRTGESLTTSQLLDELADAAVALLGEKHDNPDHHTLQLWVLQALEARRRQGAVAMEMLTLNQQTAVSQVQEQMRAGEQPKNLALALNWDKGWDWQQYASLLEHLVAQPYSLLASNLDRTALMAIYRNPPEMQGAKSTDKDVLERLSEHIREAHCNKLPPAQLPAMLAVQQQRDRSMATVLVEADKPVLLLAGAYHARYDLGVPLHIQDLQNAAELTQRVLIFAEAGQEVAANSADFVWYTPAVVEQDYCANL